MHGEKRAHAQPPGGADVVRVRAVRERVQMKDIRLLLTQRSLEHVERAVRRTAELLRGIALVRHRIAHDRSALVVVALEI
jgi:hypothetical protein